MNLQAINCQVCRVIGSILDNPYQYSGQVVAKLCVNLATVVWALVVLIKPDAIANWPATFAPPGSINEDVLALVLLTLSAFATWRLVKKSRPVGMGVCVYPIFLILWLYTLTTLLIAVVNGVTSPRPGQLAGVLVVTLLAIFAFVSNPKRRDGSPSD